MFDNFISRFRAGLLLAKGSFAVLRRKPWLLTFPLLYGLTWAIGAAVFLAFALAVLLGMGVGLLALEGLVGTDPTLALQGTFIVLGFLAMVFAAAASTYFTAGLVYCVGMRFRGEPVGVRDGLAAAWERKGTILAWGVISAIVGMILQQIQRQNNRVGQLATALVGTAWAVATFFIIPVIVFEDQGIRDSFRRSVSLIRQQWGEAAGIHLGIGIIMLPLIAVTVLVGILAPIFLLSSPGVVLLITAPITLVLVAVLVMVYVATTAIAKTALYHFAVGEALPPEFDDIDPEALATRRTQMSQIPSTV